MSVLVKGMEMPKNCGICGFKDGCEFSMPLTERPFDCPLVPVPPHGRLIDADALEYHADNVRDPMGRTEKTVMWEKIKAAPTIIEAEV